MCKRILIIGMVLLLIVSLATGCGNKDSEVTATPAAPTSTPTPAVVTNAPADSSAATETAAEFSKDDLLVEFIGAEEGKTYVSITSKVTNMNSAHTFKKAVIRVVLQNSEGKALKAESAYVVDTENLLAPGESVEFSISIEIPTSDKYTDVGYVISSIR